MEHIFSTNLTVNNKVVVYRVVFDKEAYVFICENEGQEYASFSLKRENDEWHHQNKIPSELKIQAEEALDAYLLKQN